MADFKNFLDTGGAVLGPSRHKVSLSPTTFSCLLKSQEWPSADESYLRQSFWACMEFSTASSKEALEALVPSHLIPGLKKLFCERFTAAKPLFQTVGGLAI